MTAGTSVAQPAPSSNSSLGGVVRKGPDMKVLGPVVGVVLLVAGILMTIVLCLRRRHKLSRSMSREAVSASYPSHSQGHPSLLARICGFHMVTRTMESTDTLPIHKYGSSGSSLNLSELSGGAQQNSGPSTFRPEEVDETPIYDIKQRPVSGTTMTTRVTVGTSIGHRASIPDTPYPTHLPPIPAMPKLPAEFLPPHPSGSTPPRPPRPPSSVANSLIGTNQVTNYGWGSGASEGTGITSVGDRASGVPRARPSTASIPRPPLPPLPLSSNADVPLVHKDAGVRLASNLPTPPPRAELPPPYQNYGV